MAYADDKKLDNAPQRLAYALELFDAGARYNAVRRALMAKYRISDTTGASEQRQLLGALSMTPAQRARRVKEIEAGAADATPANETAGSSNDTCGSTDSAVSIPVAGSHAQPST